MAAAAKKAYAIQLGGPHDGPAPSNYDRPAASWAGDLRRFSIALEDTRPNRNEGEAASTRWKVRGLKVEVSRPMRRAL
jgi:hypothetical protein